MSISVNLRQLWKEVSSKRRRQLSFLAALTCIGAVFEMATIGAVLPILMLIVDPEKILLSEYAEVVFGIIGKSDPAFLVRCAIGVFVFVVILSAALRLVILWAGSRIAFGVGHDISVKFFGGALSRPYEYHVAKNSSEVLAGINKVQMVVNKVLQPLLTAISGVALSFGILLGILLVDWKISIGLGAFLGGAYILVTQVTKKRLHANSRVISLTSTVRVKVLREAIGGIRDILLDHSQEVFSKDFSRHDKKLKKALVSNAVIDGSPRLIIEPLGLIVILALAVYLSQSDEVGSSTLPVLGALALGVQRLLPRLNVAYNAWSKVMGAEHIVADVVDMLKGQPLGSALEPLSATVQGDVEYVDAPDQEVGITLRRVCYRYPYTSVNVLDRIDLDIGWGSSVGIIGKTGSGKSTLIDVIMGLLQPTSGRLVVDGEVVCGGRLKAWNQSVAHVPQSIYLADKSIAENIAFGSEKDEIDMDRMRRSAIAACAYEFIEKLEKGYDTAAGDRGLKLSGGQRQRIGIARALYKSSGLIVLDEATSALDSGTEERVMRSIRMLDPNLTIIMIAHRLTTLASCDYIIRLDGGRIVDVGSYQSIVGDGTISNVS